MRKINLLYVITKLELGGAQKQLLDLIGGLDKDRFNIFLFTAKGGLLLEDARGIKGLAIENSKYLGPPINPLKDLLALIELCNFIKENNIDVVHTHSSKAGILGRFAAGWLRVKVVVHTVHGWSFNERQPMFFRKFYIWLERIAAGFTHKLIVVSGCDKQKGLDNRIGSEEKYTLIRYGIDHSEFSACAGNVRKEFGWDDKDLVVATISCLKPQKAPQDFIKLCFLNNAVLPNTRFLLVGDGFLRKKVERLIHRLSLGQDVILAGWRRDIPRLLSSVDVFVLTSLWEGLPISALEALCASKPIIATNTGGIAELIKDGETGFLVEPGDIKDMSDKLKRVLSDEDLRKRMSGAAKAALGANYTCAAMVRNTQSLYEGLLGLTS